MLRQITKAETNLEKLPYYGDKIAFNIMQTIILDEAVQIYSDGGNGFLAMQNPGMQMWVFADRALPEKSIVEAFSELLELTDDQDSMKIVCAAVHFPIMDMLIYEKYGTLAIREMEMAPYYCPGLVPEVELKGSLITAQENHKELVAGFLVGFMKDCFRVQLTAESQLERAAILIGRQELYLWQEGSEIKGMVNVAIITGKYARINNVYTRPELRGQGYGKMMMAELNRNLLQSDCIPVLYADASYPASNEVYRKTGYKEVYHVQEFEFTRR